jgi:hypothetical protein
MAFTESFWHSSATPPADIRKLENLHVVLWLLKDASWCSDWKVLGLAAAVPTIVLAARICWMSRHSFSETAHNGAVCLWICANIIWMIGEFFYQDMTRPFAKVFFFLGAALLIGYYAVSAVIPKRVNNG